MRDQYDGIIIGTGHNALVLQAYLCRSGLRVLSIDRAEMYGGGLATIENPRFPGFRHNTHAFFHRALNAMPWYRDLDLARHGADYIEPELNVALILPDGRAMEWWTSIEKTIESFAEFSNKDAAALRQWVEEFRPIVEKILLPEAQSPPLPPERRRELLSRSSLGRKLLSVSELSPIEFVEREFRHDLVRAGLLFFNGLREIDLRLKGFGHSIPALLSGQHMAQMCRGGSAKLAQALAADIQEHGGEIMTKAEPKSILVHNKRAAGVELASGERIMARAFVASGLNPQQTFLQLMDAESAPPRLRKQAAGFRYNLLSPLFALNVALEEPPRYRAADRRPELNQAFMVILGLEEYLQFPEIVRAHELGQIPPTVMWGACPTLFDATQAPNGKHTAFMWEKMPYAVQGSAAHWDSLKDRHGETMLRLWSRFAPNLQGKTVIDSFTRSPLDTERSLPNMQDGDLLVGSFAHGQVGYNRPFPGAGQYRTPIRGLYLCGGATHPGGNITGLCGYNSARTVATDLALRLWWNPPQIESVLEAL
ncbi:MAG: NAD(P)/FAD-dependent oxidoreductase [Acidobacteriota bacterium]|nr:NAD(P)/FAD-dependent oxidoreductase [Acidobacteriota bacterium]